MILGESIIVTMLINVCVFVQHWSKFEFTFETFEIKIQNIVNVGS